jgi:hypothetical protein
MTRTLNHDKVLIPFEVYVHAKYCFSNILLQIILLGIVRLINMENALLAGSYKYMLRGSTSFPNLFLAGD